jgi:hypothetical protein
MIGRPSPTQRRTISGQTAFFGALSLLATAHYYRNNTACLTSPPQSQHIRSSSSSTTTTTGTTAAADETGVLQLRLQEDNWRGAPVGDGEDSIDSYHSYDHRPPSTTTADPRDAVLLQYPIHPCPHSKLGTMVSAQDARYYELPTPENLNYKERNPKFLCDAFRIPHNNKDKKTNGSSGHPPCVVYSFGSFDEISFEVRIYYNCAIFCGIEKVFAPSLFSTRSIL